MKTASFSFSTDDISHIASSKSRREEDVEEENGDVWVKRKEEFAVPSEPAPARISPADKSLPTPGNVSGRNDQSNVSISLKRAEMRLPKHDSVARIQESNAGRVLENVRNINSSMNGSMSINGSMDSSTLGQSSFNTSVQNRSSISQPGRKRGVSPVRIPTIFATGKGEAPTAEYYRQLAQKAMRSSPNESEKGEVSEAPKIMSSASKHRSHHHHERPGSREESPAAAVPRIDLSESLMDTIEDVLTPARQRQRNPHHHHHHHHHHKEERAASPLQETTNTHTDLPASLGLNTDTFQLRTSRGLTPHQVLQHGALAPGSQRSPGKVVKRLQSAQRSPKHSPLTAARQSPQQAARLPLKSRDFHEQY
jgi:hypothetical protein